MNSSETLLIQKAKNRTEPRANRNLLAVIGAATLCITSPPAITAERDPQIVECEAGWGKIALEGQKEGNEKKVADATKEKLACEENIEPLIQAEKIILEAVNRFAQNKKYFDILKANSQKISSYLKGESSIPKVEAQRILTEYEHAIDELMKYPDFDKEKDQDNFSFHKKLIEQAKEKIS